MFISSEGVRGLCGSLPRWKTKISFPKKTIKSLVLLTYIYLNMLPLFDIPFSAFTWHLFLTSSFSSDPSFLQLPEQDVTPTLSYIQSFSCGSWVAQGHLNIIPPLLTLQGVTGLPGMAYRHWPSQVSARRQHWESRLSSSRAGRFKR